MNCFSIAALALRVASPDPAVLIETECGLQAGIGEHRGEIAGEVGFRRQIVGPLYARVGVQVYRMADREQEILIEHSPRPGEKTTHDFSITRVPLDTSPRWRVSPSAAVGVALPLNRRVRAWAEVEPFARQVHAGLSVRF